MQLLHKTLFLMLVLQMQFVINNVFETKSGAK